jgi:hypothetical protein
MIRSVLCVALAFSCTLLLGQAPSDAIKGKGSAQQPAAAPSDALSLLNVMSAKISDDKARLVLMAPKKQAETRTRTVAVTRMVTEARTRVVKDPTGNNVEQTYHVKIPVTEQFEQEYVTFAITGMQQHEVDFSAVRAWRLSGEPLDAGKLSEWLKESRKVFALEMPLTEKFTATEPYYAEVLKPDTVMIYLPPGELSKTGLPT